MGCEKMKKVKRARLGDEELGKKGGTSGDQTSFRGQIRGVGKTACNVKGRVKEGRDVGRNAGLMGGGGGGGGLVTR